MQVNVGDVFNLRYRYSKENLYGHDDNTEITDLIKINLKVDKIYHLNRYLNFIEKGHTGGFYFSGDGLEFLDEDSFLVGEKNMDLFNMPLF